MNYRWIGALLVVLGCGGFGFSMAAAHRKEEYTLRQLLSALDYMECELQFRLTPLPELCRLAGREAKGSVREVLLTLSRELDMQMAPDVDGCMKAAVIRSGTLPPRIKEILLHMGRSLGRFDLEGQLKGLEAARGTCRRELDALTHNRDSRLRSYQTLGLCAGAALAILLI